MLVHAARNFARADHHDHDLFAALQWRELQVTHHRRTFTATNVHVVYKQRRTVLAGTIEWLLKRCVDHDLFPNPLTCQRFARHVQKAFSGGVT